MTTQVAPPARKLGETSRRDRWWVQPALIVVGLSAFGVYAIVVAALNINYVDTVDGARLLSPFYSPNLTGLFHVPFSYAFFVLWAPLGLRTSCYYYRKSIYRSFFLAPPGCTVAGLQRRKYAGETKLPFVLMNLHRFFFYAATIVVGFLWFDAFRSLFYSGGRVGISIGTVIMFVNVILLSAFTFGCNSFRHLIGGGLNCFDSCTSERVRHGLWKKVTVLNGRHQSWAWYSMASVAITDLYIRLGAAHVFVDPHVIF